MKRIAILALLLTCGIAAATPFSDSIYALRDYKWPGLLDYDPAFAHVAQWDYGSALHKAASVASTVCPSGLYWTVSRPRYQFDCRWEFDIYYSEPMYNQYGEIMYMRQIGRATYVIQYVENKHTHAVGWIVGGHTNCY